MAAGSPSIARSTELPHAYARSKAVEAFRGLGRVLRLQVSVHTSSERHVGVAQAPTCKRSTPSSSASVADV